jgi:hypothetical protein
MLWSSAAKCPSKDIMFIIVFSFFLIFCFLWIHS